MKYYDARAFLRRAADSNVTVNEAVFVFDQAASACKKVTRLQAGMI